MITEKEIEKGNELLTKFLIPHFVGTIWFIEDWDWIIKTFEKIEELGYDWSILDGEVEISESGYQWLTHAVEAKNEKQTLIEAAFKCCVDFVEQYNAKTLKQATK
jgi:hypothetical protein